MSANTQNTIKLCIKKRNNRFCTDGYRVVNDFNGNIQLIDQRGLWVANFPFGQNKSMSYYLQLLVLSVGFVAVGWFLAAIQAKVLIWLSLVSLVIYLVNTQKGGLVLAHGWLAMLISLSTVTRIWPAVWPSHIPYDKPRLWALIVLIIWAMAALLIHLLASLPQLTQRQLQNRPVLFLNTVSPHQSLAYPSILITTTLIALVSSAIVLGAVTYSWGVGL